MLRQLLLKNTLLNFFGLISVCSILEWSHASSNKSYHMMHASFHTQHVSRRYNNNHPKNLSCFTTPSPFVRKKIAKINKHDIRKNNDCPLPGSYHVQNEIFVGRRTESQLSMGLWDKISSFISDRSDDFVRLENSDNGFGPGPVVLLYGCPESIDDDEILLMIEDGAPMATKRFGKGVTLARIASKKDELLDCTVSDALERIMTKGGERVVTASDETTLNIPFPVIYFSGISNEEMMKTYNIIAEEIYKETGGAMKSACAKAVEPAMSKSLRDVMEQISGDHMEAISSE